MTRIVTALASFSDVSGSHSDQCQIYPVLVTIRDDDVQNSNSHGMMTPLSPSLLQLGWQTARRASTFEALEPLLDPHFF